MNHDPAQGSGADSPAEETVPDLELTTPASNRPPTDLSRLWLSLFAWSQHFRVSSRAAFASLLVILAHFTLFLVVASNLCADSGPVQDHE